MSLGNPIKLVSVTFRESVRYPGSGQGSHYITTPDYVLNYYPEVQLIEARLRDGINPMPHFTKRAFYPVSAAKDMLVHDSEQPSALKTNDSGQLMAPNHKLVSRSDGSFERVTDDAEPVAEAVPVEAPKRRGRPPKAKPEASEVTRPPAMPPTMTVQHPRVRSTAQGSGA